MPPWVIRLLQQFGRDIIINSPAAARAIKREHDALRGPYLDKRLYWCGRGGDAERDAEDHRAYDAMAPRQRQRLADRQASGQLEATKPKFRRAWTGAVQSLVDARESVGPLPLDRWCEELRARPLNRAAAEEEGPGGSQLRGPGSPHGRT
jgi:hypothetical protein